ncbi:MAG: hypothetical protein AAFZ18_17850 [Myxococcota bacterium]
MSDDRAYRIVVQYLPEEERFQARSPELDVEAKAETRAEAIAAVETVIEETFERAAVEGTKLRRPADLATEVGELTLELAAPLWRDLQVHATAQGLAPEALALQLLTRSLGHLEGRGGRRGARGGEAKAAPPKEGEVQGGEEQQQQQPSNRPEKKEGGGKRGRGRGRGRREGYRPDMEDQANFLAYVRDQERGGRGRR